MTKKELINDLKSVTDDTKIVVMINRFCEVDPKFGIHDEIDKEGKSHNSIFVLGNFNSENLQSMALIKP